MKRVFRRIMSMAFFAALISPLSAEWSKANTHWVDMAASKNHAQALANIKDGHIRPNIADEDGNTPLMMAAREGDFPAAQELILRGADINAMTNYHYNVMRSAISGRNFDIVALLVAKGIDVNKLFDNSGSTPLMEAARFGSLPMVNLLLAHGAKVNARTQNGTDALAEAAETEHPEVIATLIDQGAEPNHLGENDMTPLMWAAISGHPSVVKMLVQKGAKVDMRNKSYGMTALLLASSQPVRPPADNLGVVSCLLQSGANPRLQDKHGTGPLMGAAVWDRADLIRTLAAHGADLKSPNGDGAKAFAFAFNQKHRFAVKALLDAGLDPNLTIDNNSPILIRAIEMQDLATVELLIAAKANVNVTVSQVMLGMYIGPAPRPNIYSALIAAVDRGTASMVEALLKGGANRNYKDSTGRTALDHAQAKKNEEMVELLK